MAQDKWVEIWRLFDPDEQHDACRCLLEEMKENWGDSITRRLVSRLAKGTGSRIASVEAMIRDKPDKAATQVRTRAAALLDDGLWKRLFEAYLPRRKSSLLKAFVEALGLEHDGDGRVEADFPPPSPERVAAAVESLLRTYSPHEVARYLTVIIRHSPSWQFAAAERDRLMASIKMPVSGTEESSIAQAELAAASSMEFSVLDRVLIEQVVRAAMQIEGSLDGRQVEELVELVTRLNEKWHRGYFHLGFMDVLLPGRELTFDRPGDNASRRGWYLAGVIAGLVRGNDLNALNKVFDQRNGDLLAALGESGGSGASITRTAFLRLVDSGRLTEALAAIRGQLKQLGLGFGVEALEVATVFIRQARYEHAKAIVDGLSKVSFENEDDDEIVGFHLALSRRRGQCLQAVGDFDGAEREYRELLKAGEDKNSPDLLADLGLVKGRFRSVDEVRVPHGVAERVAMRESLAKGDECFQRAAERYGIESPKSAFALAVLGYLRWIFAEQKDRDECREHAAMLASNAVSAIFASEFAGIYRALGALGHAQFILAVTRMNSFEDVQGREALAAWNTITDEAGKFPAEDLRLLLDAAEAYGPDVADPIAESVIEYRRDDALEILKGGQWMTRSLRLRAVLKSMAQAESTPRVERLGVWMLLVPLLIKGGDIPGAEEGLGEIEQLAETEEDVGKVLEFLTNRPNYDPAWKESEAALARVYLLRRVGRDTDSSQELRLLFYLFRDSNRWEAEQLVAMADEWNLDAALQDELRRGLPKTEAEEPRDVDQRLRDGERVRVVFIGGNEVQEQYDEAVAEQLAREWRGLSVQFEHTGWSSNWGRDLARLIELANSSDAVVLMPMMRTTLGRRIRRALKKPWLSCTSTGRVGMLASVRQAARLAVRLRLGGPAAH